MITPKLLNKISHSIQQIQKYEKIALQYNENGFHIAFSGGKDSQCVLQLCKEAGVKFKSYFYKTSVDPPEVLSFIRNNYPFVEWIKPKFTMYQLILKKGMLPLAHARFCCEHLKERNGLNSVVVSGLRKAESRKRQKREEFEVSCKIGQDKVMVNPIIYWTRQDVWQFLNSRNIATCPLYEKQKRTGCIGCPNSPNQIRIDFANRPNFEKAYTNTVRKLMETKKVYKEFASAEEVIKWWTSGLSRKNFIDSKQQTIINYDICNL
jgi:phosphoadenosine phosphosulfate reductase